MAHKYLKMFEKVEVSVLGIVENMSTHICSNCGHEEHIFGSGGGQQMATQYGVDLLGSLPLDIHIREGVDDGKPTSVGDGGRGGGDRRDGGKGGGKQRPRGGRSDKPKRPVET